jgi:hypothetical protein
MIRQLASVRSKSSAKPVIWNRSQMPGTSSNDRAAPAARDDELPRDAAQR